MSAKTERITILGSPDFKAFLMSEAEKEGVSVSQLVRNRCNNRSVSEDEELLLHLPAEVRASTLSAKQSLEKGLKEAEMTLKALQTS